MSKPVEKSARLMMIREDMENIPEFPVPAGFKLRWYEAGDETLWVHIQQLADQYNQITAKLFTQQFGTDPFLLSQRQCFLFDRAENAIGTATAWFDDDFEGQRIGRVHWVAVVPQYHGRQLSKPLMTTVCGRLRELGHNRAYLSTMAARKPAIQLYRRFGFSPLIRNKEEKAAWRELIPTVQRQK